MLVAAVNSNAQDTVVTDSSTVISEDEAPPDEEPTTEEAPYYPDTLKRDYRAIIFDTVKAISNDKGFYYKRYMDSLLRASQVKKPQRSRKPGFNPYDSVFGLIFWIIAIGLLGFLIYRLFLSNGSFISRNRKNISSDITVNAEENIDDPEWQLQQALKNENYRLAVRYLYLLSLKRLADKNYIQINSNKTNYEYVNEVRKRRFANEFASLTLQYEYVWYGEYPVDQRLFENIQGGFNRFHKNYTW